MLNTITIWRPFKSVKKSVQSLSPEDLAEAKFNTAQVILCFMVKLNTIKENIPDVVKNNYNIQYYWNGGKPYLYDLIWYYTYCRRKWTKDGGDPIDFLKEYYKVIYSCPFWDNKSKWTSSMSNMHAFKLMELNHFWYQRFFVSGDKAWRYLQLFDNTMYIDGKLRRIKDEEVKSLTFCNR